MGSAAAETEAAAEAAEEAADCNTKHGNEATRQTCTTKTDNCRLRRNDERTWVVAAADLLGETRQKSGQEFKIPSA